jgi:hypothetical protein
MAQWLILHAQAELGRFQDARQTMEALRARDPRMARDYRLDALEVSWPTD